MKLTPNIFPISNTVPFPKGKWGSQVDGKAFKKASLLAISVFFGLGLLFSYALGGAWTLTLGFFCLAAAPLFYMGKSENFPETRIKE